jgi:hypothetical protein
LAILTLGPCSRQIFRDPISRWPLELRPQHIYIIVTSWWPSLLRKKEFLKNLKFFPFPHWNWPAPHPHTPTPSDLWPSLIDLSFYPLQEYIVVSDHLTTWGLTTDSVKQYKPKYILMFHRVDQQLIWLKNHNLAAEWARHVKLGHLVLNCVQIKKKILKKI